MNAISPQRPAAEHLSNQRRLPIVIVGHVDHGKSTWSAAS